MIQPRSEYMLYCVAQVQQPCEDDLGRIRKGYAGCWINTSSVPEMELRLKQVLSDAEWELLSIDEVNQVALEDYPPGNEYRKYYLQAIEDGEVLVVFTGPS